MADIDMILTFLTQNSAISISFTAAYNAITGTNPYSWTLTDPRGVRVCLTYQHAGTLTSSSRLRLNFNILNLKTPSR